MNLAFVGFKHRHTGEIYREAINNPNITVLGAWEDTEEGKKLAEGIGVEFNYLTFESVLADERVEAICLGGAFGERGEEAIKALNAGKHVYADKPLCITLDELEEIEKLSKEKNLKVGCYLTMRLHDGIQSLREMIAEGKLGEIGAVNITAQHPLQYGTRPSWYYKDGMHGGTINDIGIHAIDIVHFVTGKKIKEITAARTWNHFAEKEPQFHDCAQFMLELENNTGLIADVSYAAPSSCGFSIETYWRMTFWGTRGVAEYKLKAKQETPNGTEVSSLLQVALDGGDGFVPVEKKKYNTTALDEFIREIRGESDLLIDTEGVFFASRQALAVQEAANGHLRTENKK